MGLLARVRRLNGGGSSAAAPPAPPPEDAAETTPHPAAAAPPEPVAAARGNRRPSGIQGLRDGLQQLYAIRPTRDAFAAEAVKLIAKGAGVPAAALLAYEQRAGRVRLLAHVGLDADA